ncbi:hypothetical protein B566_EDAN001884 [Ephemera danica]|nr:hypothetical protein B566_EDAN001884 [Ephemera danica]
MATGSPLGIILALNNEFELDTPPTRRSTRSALSDVSHRTAGLTMTTPTWNMNWLPTPSPSPDELVIQQRGRRKMPSSPEMNKDRTPVKLPPQSPSKSSIVLRSTPRKRLLMNDISDPPSPDRSPRAKVSRMATSLGSLSLQSSSPAKKIKSERLAAIDNVPDSLPLALKGLSHDQLVEMVLMLTKDRPDLEKEVKEQMPAPDLRPVEEELTALKKNIFKALPTSRLTSKFDSPAYNRASTHVMCFKKAVVEHGKQLVDSQHWGAVVEFVLMAWKCVRSTPLWENSTHNTMRRQCFKTLASQCMTALKRGNFTAAECQTITDKLDGFQSDSEDIQSVLKQLGVMKSKLTTPTKVSNGNTGGSQ